MDTIIEQQTAMDEALVPHAQRLRIGKSNFCLLSDIKSKESTLQLVYDVLRICPFFKAFLVTADVPKIYMQEFWATATVHHHAIRFKMDNKKHIVNLESFRDMLHICLRVHGQSFDEPSFEEDILAFIHFLGHIAAIRRSLIGSSADEGTGSKPGVPDVPTDESEEELFWNYTDDEGDDNEEKDDDGDEEDEGNDGGDDEQEYDEEEYAEETRDEESFDLIPQTPKNSKDEGDGKGIQANLEVEDSHVTLTSVNPDGQHQSSSVSSQFVTSMLNQTLDVGMESIFKTTSQLDVQTPTSVAPLPMTTPTMTPFTIATITITSQAPILPTTVPSNIIQNLLNFGSLFRFDDRLRSLEANFSEFRQTNQFAGATDRLRDEAQRENDEYLKSVDENMKKIIKEQVKDQVKVQVSKILPRIEQAVNEQLEAEVLTRSSHSSRTSYAVAADISEMELKKILIEKMEGNKSIQCSDEQRNLYKALVEAYESDKIILDTYGETVTLKRRQDNDADKDKEPSAGPDRGSKRRREGKEHESASALTKTATRSIGRSTQWSRSRQASASESTLAEEPMQTTSQIEEPSHPEFDAGADDQLIVQSSQHPEWFSQQQKPPTLDRDWNKTLLAVHRSIQPWISELAKQADTHSSFNKLMDTSLDFSNFLINRLKVDTLTPELLAGPTYELMTGSCKSLVELEYYLKEVFKATTDQLDWVNPEGQQYPHNLLQPLPLIPNNRGCRVISFDHFINNDLKYLWGGASSRKYTTSITKTKAANYEHIKWIEDLFYDFAVNWESARDVYSKRRIIAVTELKIVEWHSYKHLDWITVRRDDDKLYKFKEGDFKRLRIQDIKDMLLLLRRVKDLQLGVESYQKKLNLTKPDTYCSDLKHKEAYIAYSNPRGFIYQNKDKKNRLMRIDELYKFSDGMLIDVRTALDDRLKWIRMRYLPQTIWRKSNKDRAAAMIQAIDKRLKTRGIIRSLERFVGGRSTLTDLQVTPTKPGRITKPYSSHRFIANCSNAGNIKMEVKVPGSSCLTNS
uniref:Uncharacterized protein n=1 Tax=Tanacetum cinerariifolium TaxID=118510 RepID=A0A699HFI3_TANCI|nr:hypothetical protein [Tanacetum cinerariifolium]